MSDIPLDTNTNPNNGIPRELSCIAPKYGSTVCGRAIEKGQYCALDYLNIVEGRNEMCHGTARNGSRCSLLALPGLLMCGFHIILPNEMEFMDIAKIGLDSEYYSMSEDIPCSKVSIFKFKCDKTMRNCTKHANKVNRCNHYIQEFECRCPRIAYRSRDNRHMLCWEHMKMFS